MKKMRRRRRRRKNGRSAVDRNEINGHKRAAM